MAEKKKQHYVPKFYLRLFTADNKMFAVQNIATKKILYPVPYDDHCYKDYFYGKDGVWENQLSNMETEWSIIIKKALNKEVLTYSDLESIKKFALYQRQRTLAEENYSIQSRKALLVEQSKVFLANKGLVCNEETVEEICLQRAKESIAPAESLQFAVDYLKEIDDLSIVVIEYDTKQELFSSDVPVISINPFHLQTIGYGCMGLIMLFPISPHHLIVIYDTKMYPYYSGKQYVTLANETEVLYLNVLQLISAEKILYGCKPQSFGNLTAEHWKIRNQNRNFSGVHALGPESQKLIGLSLRKTILKHDFSFGKIHPNFANIPFSCREAVSRKWDDKWEEKLNTKVDILPQIFEQKPDALKSLGLTKKELRKGCERMAWAAKKYWSDT